MSKSPDILSENGQEEVDIQQAELASEGDEGVRFIIEGVEYICPPGSVPATYEDGTAGCA